MTTEEKMEALNSQLYAHCAYVNCNECEFYDEHGTGEDEYYCGIRDNNAKIPWHTGWNMKIALGLEKPYDTVFPEEVRKSIMQHFTKGE